MFLVGVLGSMAVGRSGSRRADGKRGQGWKRDWVKMRGAAAGRQPKCVLPRLVRLRRLSRYTGKWVLRLGKHRHGDFFILKYIDVG